MATLVVAESSEIAKGAAVTTTSDTSPSSGEPAAGGAWARAGAAAARVSRLAPRRARDRRMGEAPRKIEECYEITYLVVKRLDAKAGARSVA
jgi:hypothetical protein